MSRYMKAANKPSYTAIMVLGFLCLATYAYGQKPEEYASRAEFNAVLDNVLGDASTRKDEASFNDDKPSSPAKPVSLIIPGKEREYDNLTKLAEDIKAGRDVKALYAEYGQ